MNAYIPVLDQQPPPGFICNVTWRHVGPQKVVGHTPPRLMDIECPCVICTMERKFIKDDLVLGPVWFGYEEPVGDVAEYVGLYSCEETGK